MSSETKRIIEVKDLVYIYRTKTRALNEVSCCIQEAEIVGIIGQNGSGKTTLVKHFNGLLKPTEGTVIVCGIDTRSASTSMLARHVGYVFQNPNHQIFSPTVIEEIRFGPRNIRMEKRLMEQQIQFALDLMELGHLIHKHPYHLSRGERQRLAIASVVAMDPDIMILDEPTCGANRQQIQRLLNLIQRFHKMGKTIILITHDMAVLSAICQHTFVMRQGKVMLEGPTREVMKEVQQLAQTFLTPPQVAQLSIRLELPELALTVEEAAEMILTS
jgi:energy-coupling factor transporter ATP-binding protein EcfA2